MAGEKIAIEMIPTPATQDIPDKEILRLSRITKIPVEKVKRRIATGKGITIVTQKHPKVAELVKLVKTLGFSVTTTPVDKRNNPAQALSKAKTTIPIQPPPSKKREAEWNVGQVIENLYEVTDIKYGGMGAVYVARHMRWNTMLAIKSLLRKLRKNEEDRALFVKEAETWIDIGFHPNIAACYYVRNILESPRIFVEYVDGGALKEWLIGLGRPAGWDLIIDLMVQAADGLEHAHVKGLVHRDVKPANCMMTRDGILKVTDFGLTKRRTMDPAVGETTAEITGTVVIRRERESVTAAGMGTPGYMAPEMWIPNSEVGPPADIYAFGVMFFEICCGTKPFPVKRGEKRDKLALAHLKKPPPRPRSVRQDMPKSIESIILKCLEKKPESRPESFAQIRTMLEEAYEGAFKRRYPRERPDEVKLHSDALNNRAVSLMDLHHEEEAREALKGALDADPHHPEAVYNLGLLQWFQTKNPNPELIVRMEEVVKSPEYRGRGGHLLGRCLLTMGEAERAVKACELSLATEDATEGWLKPYAIGLIGMGRDEDAITYLETYLTDITHNDEAEGWLIGALVRTGETEKARRRVEELPENSALAGKPVEQIETEFRFSGTSARYILKGHNGWITCVAPFPSTAQVISGSRDRFVKIWDAETGQELKSVNVVGDPPASIRISPDERLAAIAGNRAGAPVKLLDTEAGKLVGNLLTQDQVTALAFTPDGDRVLVVEARGLARIWDTAECKAGTTFKVPRHTAAEAMYTQAGIPVVFTAGMDRLVKKTEGENTDPMVFEKGHTEQITAMSVDREGRRVLTTGRDRQVIVWNAETGATISVFGVHSDTVTSLALSPEGRRSASFDAQEGLKVWEAETGTVLRTFDPAEYGADCLAFSADGAQVIAGGRGMAVCAWDVYGRAIWPEVALAKIRPVTKQIKSDREFKENLQKAGKAMRRGARATAYGLLRKAQKLPGYERSDQVLAAILRMKDYGKRLGLRGGWGRRVLTTPSGVMAVGFSPSAIAFLTAQSDHTIRMWSTKTGDCTRTLKGHTNLVASISFSPNGREAVSGGDDRTVRLWDLNMGKNSATLQGHTESVSSVAYSPAGDFVLSGSWDRTVRLWRIPDHTLFKTLKGHDDRVSTVAFIRDSGLILSAGFDGVVKMWEIASGRALRDLRGHRDQVTSLDVSTDGELLITGSMDGAARIWDVRRGTAVRTLEVDESGVRAVQFTPDSRFALTASNDTLLRVWDTAGGECIREFQGHAKEITSAAVSWDGRFVLTSSVDGTVRLWELDWDWEFHDSEDAGKPDPFD